MAEQEQRVGEWASGQMGDVGVSAPWVLRTDRTYKTNGTNMSDLISPIGPI
jgi:hypothetical protein